jgi:hypothetical protein
MRNVYAGNCYRCGIRVEPGTGYFERHKGKWRVQHCYHGHEGGHLNAKGVTCEMARAALDRVRKP